MKSLNILRQLLKIGLALAALVLVIMWMSGMFRAKIQPSAAALPNVSVPPNAQTAPVEEQKLPMTEEASGTVEAKRKTLVSSRIMATIREVKVRPGDQVAEGEILALLDDRELAAHAQQAERAIDAAQAASTKATADYNRAKELLGRSVIGRSEYEQSESAYKIALAQLEAAQKAKQAADVASSYAAITAPVSGRVVERYADPGDTASPGQPMLAIYDPQSLRIEAPVRESLLRSIKVGNSISVRIGDSKTIIEGTVGEIVPDAEVGSRTFLVKVDLPGGENIFTGMFARIQIPAGERTRFVVDRRGVQTIGQLNFVDCLGADNTLSRRLVTLGADAGDGKVEVLSGLAKSERVLLK